MDFTVFLTIFLSLQTRSHGKEDFAHFINKHRSAIESVVMVGYGRGWRHCDVLALSPQQEDLPTGEPILRPILALNSTL